MWPPRVLILLLASACLLPTGCRTALSGGPVGQPAQRTNVNSTAAPSTPPDAAKPAPAPVSRAFRFTYGATLHELPKDAKVRVWLPLPPSNKHQTVKLLEQRLPVAGRRTTEPAYGNRILYFELPAPDSGQVDFDLGWRIERAEVRGLNAPGEKPPPLTDDQRRRFVAPNAKVPIDGKPLELIQDLSLPEDEVELARALYARVDEHMWYDKSQPGYGQGDVLWACDSRTGNCTDFHSLFISLARSQRLPARFEIGFPLPVERGAGSVGGYHCWASFYVADRGWVPVDISEADKHPKLKTYCFGNLTENRVAFTTGRDLTLEPPQDGPPLNYFIYPYAEVDGQRWPVEKTEQRFSYRDE